MGWTPYLLNIAKKHYGFWQTYFPRFRYALALTPRRQAPFCRAAVCVWSEAVSPLLLLLCRQLPVLTVRLKRGTKDVQKADLSTGLNVTSRTGLSPRSQPRSEAHWPGRVPRLPPARGAVRLCKPATSAGSAAVPPWPDRGVPPPCGCRMATRPFPPLEARCPRRTAALSRLPWARRAPTARSPHGPGPPEAKVSAAHTLASGSDVPRRWRHPQPIPGGRRGRAANQERPGAALPDLQVSLRREGGGGKRGIKTPPLR